MRFNLLRVICALSALIPFMFCDRSDVVTGAGSSVIKEVDPALVDMGGGFVRVIIYDFDRNKYDSIVDTAEFRSLPASRDPLRSTYLSDNIRIGVTGEGDTLAAQMQFRVGGGTTYDTSRIRHPEVKIYFQAADSVGASAQIALFLCKDTISESTPVNKNPDNNTPIGQFSLAAGNGTDSVTFSDSTDLTKLLFNMKMSKDTTTVVFGIIDYAGAPLRIAAPKIVISASYCKELDGINCDTTLTVTLGEIQCSRIRYTVFEGAAEERAKTPYSSHLTKRTAVLKLNMKPIFNALSEKELNPKNSELLNAVIAVLPDSSKDTVGKYTALASDTLLPYNELVWAYTADLKSPYNTLSFNAAMRSVMKKFSENEQYEPYIYVYLRPATEGGVIMWDKKLPKIEAVFTPSRSQSR